MGGTGLIMMKINRYNKSKGKRKVREGMHKVKQQNLFKNQDMAQIEELISQNDSRWCENAEFEPNLLNNTHTQFYLVTLGARKKQNLRQPTQAAKSNGIYRKARNCNVK